MTFFSFLTQERERREDGRCREGETLDKRRERKRRGAEQINVIDAKKGRRTGHRKIVQRDIKRSNSCRTQ
jgi:hypothetical protein